MKRGRSIHAPASFQDLQIAVGIWFGKQYWTHLACAFNGSHTAESSSSGPTHACSPPQALDMSEFAVRYLSSPIIWSAVFFRGIGDSRMPPITVAIACVLNIAGDLFFVAVFRMGVAGTALATVLSQAVSVLLSVGIIRRRELPFSLSRESLRPGLGLYRRIFHLGVPIAFQDFLISISFLVILAIVNSLGLISSAGVGVAEKLCAFIMLAPSAYIQSMSAFVVQNIGAGKPGRAKRVLFCRILSSLAAGVGMAYFSFFHSELTASLFSNDRNVIFAAADYMRAYAIDCILTFCRSHCAPDICCCLRNGAPISRRKICFECRGR